MHFRNTHSHPTVVEAVVEENTTCVGVEIFVTSWCWLAMEGCRLRAPLNGTSTLESIHYIHLQGIRDCDSLLSKRERERERTREDHPHL